MKKSITISIPEPCHEDWGKMTPTEKGRFCDVCTKEVFDFSKSSDEELIKKLESGTNLCGKFQKSQLDREVKLERKSGKGILPYAASLLLPLSLLNSSEMNAQGGASLAETNFTSLGIGSNPIKSLVTITGFITDVNNIPIQNAEVFVLETGDSVRTGPDGSYRIVCTSGSTIYAKKDDLTSEPIVLGTKDAAIDMQIFEIKIPYTAIYGNIVTVPTKISCGLTLIPEKEESVELESIENSTEVQTVVIKAEKAETLKGTLGRPVIERTEEETVPEKKEEESTFIKISGTITDESKLPLPGVNVIVKGTSNGTQTDFDGNYVIELEANRTLVYSYLGYRTEEIVTSNISNTIDLQMDFHDEFLGEVVVVGRFIADPIPAVNNPFNYEPPVHDPEREARIAKRKLAAANEVAFKKIKKERARVARQAKKALKKKKK